MARPNIMTKGLLEIGLLIIDARRKIVEGAVNPPWPVVDRPVSNHLSSLWLKLKTGYKGVTREELQELIDYGGQEGMPRLDHETLKKLQHLDRLGPEIERAAKQLAGGEDVSPRHRQAAARLLKVIGEYNEIGADTRGKDKHRKGKSV